MRRHLLTSLLFAMLLVALPVFACAKGAACCQPGVPCRGELQTTAAVICCSAVPARTQATVTAEIGKNESKCADEPAASPIRADERFDEKSTIPPERLFSARALAAFASRGQRIYLATARLRL